MERWQSWSIALDLKSRDLERDPWVRILLSPPNGDCGVMVSTNDCGSFSQGSSPAVTQIKFNVMVVLLIVLVSFLISIPLAKEMAEVYGDDDPFTNWRKKD